MWGFSWVLRLHGIVYDDGAVGGAIGLLLVYRYCQLVVQVMLTFRVDGCWPLSFSLSTSVSTLRAGPNVSRCFVRKCCPLAQTAECLPCVPGSVCFLILNNCAP